MVDILLGIISNMIVVLEPLYALHVAFLSSKISGQGSMATFCISQNVLLCSNEKNKKIIS